MVALTFTLSACETASWAPILMDDDLIIVQSKSGFPPCIYTETGIIYANAKDPTEATILAR